MRHSVQKTSIYKYMTCIVSLSKLLSKLLSAVFMFIVYFVAYVIILLSVAVIICRRHLLLNEK